MSQFSMHIEAVSTATDELWEAFQRLIPQLTSNNRPPTRGDLKTLIESNATLLIARSTEHESAIVGAACLIVYRVPTGIRAIVEDVIVDVSERGRGIGEALVLRCLEIAREKGAPGVSLTSNPRREAANHLYARMGFRRRETNSYYYRFL